MSKYSKGNEGIVQFRKKKTKQNGGKGGGRCQTYKIAVSIYSMGNVCIKQLKTNGVWGMNPRSSHVIEITGGTEICNTYKTAVLKYSKSIAGIVQLK